MSDEQQRGRRRALKAMHEQDGDHPHTVVVLERNGMRACYTLNEADSMGLHLTRYVDGEESHEECLTWNEAARMIRNMTMRIYGMTDEEVENLG